MKSLLLLLLIGLHAYGSEVTLDTDSTHQSKKIETTLKIMIGTHTFKALLLDNATTRALIQMLPLSLEMNEFNGNEKYFHFASNLPTQPSSLKTIHAGDLMLYENNSFVLFYQTFSTSYAYTKLGHIEDTTNLAHALGKGSVKVMLELE